MRPLTHRFFHHALARATAAGVISRDVVVTVWLPSDDSMNDNISSTSQIGGVHSQLDGHPHFSIVRMAVGTRICGAVIPVLRRHNIDFSLGTLRVEPSLDHTSTGLQFMWSNTRHGRRTNFSPPTPVDISTPYSHLFEKTGIAAASAIEAAIRKRRQKSDACPVPISWFETVLFVVSD